MNRLTLAGLTIFVTLAVGLVLGVAYLGADEMVAGFVTTVLGIIALSISQMLQHKTTEEAKKVTEELSADLHNGTFRRLMKEALVELVKENGVPLEIQNTTPATTREEGNDNG